MWIFDQEQGIDKPLQLPQQSDYFEVENDMTLKEPAQHCCDQMVNSSV